MIHKAAAGNRICMLRKQAGYSQAAFADRLGVSPQAVSKWETGLALPDIEILVTISSMFRTSINEILEGNNILNKIVNRPFDMVDIAYFVPKQERDCNMEWAKVIEEENRIQKNWELRKENIAGFTAAAKKIIEHGGLILEIGAGPGGGYMPAVLLNKPDANIIISDLSPAIVREWKKFLDSGMNPPNVCYAALDNCDLPFMDNSIDVISAGGGFGNTEGDKFKALREIYRVLKPGGLYVSGDAYVTQETLKGFAPDVQKTLLKERPDIFEDFYDASVTAGFKTIDNKILPGWSTKNDDSLVADLARKLNIEIIFSGYLRFCIKQAAGNERACFIVS